MWIVEIGIAITAEDLDIWQEIAGIKEQKAELGKKEDWNIKTMDKD